MQLLIDEYQKVKEKDFVLHFVYPDETQRQNMRTIHRDKTQSEIQDIRRSNVNLSEIVSKMQKGEIRKEDFDEKTIQELKDVLFS